jgi:SAM-dependent methyltransferase
MTEPNFFRTGSPFLKHPLLTDERTSLEIDFLLQYLPLPDGAKILDVGCGFGRHSIELARRGFEVVGIDPSAAMVAASQERAQEAGVNVDFIQSKAEDFNSQEPFDAAICLFTTLGQMDENGDNIDLLPQIAKSLKTEGHFIIEVPQRFWVINNLKVNERIGEEPRHVDVKRHYDGFQKTLTEHFRIHSPGDKEDFILRYRLYRFEDLRYLLFDAGFDTEAAFGGYELVPLDEESPIQLLFTRKADLAGADRSYQVEPPPNT